MLRLFVIHFRHNVCGFVHSFVGWGVAFSRGSFSSKFHVVLAPFRGRRLQVLLHLHVLYITL